MARNATVRWRSVTLTVLLAAGTPAAFPDRAVAAGDALTLRVNDARAQPGGLVEVVVRTYATRGMTQGEICLTASGATNSLTTGTVALKSFRSKSLPAPFVALEAVEMAGAAGDVTGQAAFDEASQMALIRFSSPSGSVNQVDGPLAKFYFRVSSNFAGPAEFEIDIDLGGTFLIDADGDTVELEPRSGELEIRAEGDLLRLEAVGDRVAAGEVARLSVETHEAFPVAGGRLVLTYDPEFADGAPQLGMDAADGEVAFTVDSSAAGTVAVSFEALDSPLNRDPGRLLTLRLPTSSELTDGAKSVFAIDSGASVLVDSEGRWIGLELKAGELEIDG